MDEIVVGPYQGEFGWECMEWVPVWRARLREKKARVVVYAPATSHFLYADFAHEFHHVPRGRNAGCFRAREDGVTVPNSNPPRGGVRERRSYQRAEHAWYQYGEAGEREWDVLIHARNMEKKAQRNWDLNWDPGVVKGWGRVASVGLKGESLHVEGTEDLRGMEGKELTTVMRRSGCCVGPTSGGLHLATLCGCPVVCWTFDRNSWDWMHGRWNPLGVDVRATQSPPEPEWVDKQVRSLI